jgi:hypothetical protein
VLTQAVLLRGVPQGFRARARTGSPLSAASARESSAMLPTFASVAEATEVMSALVAEQSSAI